MHFFLPHGNIYAYIEFGAAGASVRVRGQGVKGKQVKNLCDLVTVSQERMIFAEMQSLILSGLGRRSRVWTGKPGNLPAVGTGIYFPDHEELIVPVCAALRQISDSAG